MPTRKKSAKPKRVESGPARHDFLLEIGCEELPADFMPGFLDADPEGRGLGAIAAQVFDGLSLDWKRLTVYGTPRRLVLRVEGVAPVVRIEEKGPPVRIAFDADGRPTAAATAFARRQGVVLGRLKRKVLGKEEVLIAEKQRTASQQLFEAVPKILSDLPAPKTMRWDASGIRFARPIRWLLALYGKQPVPCRLGMLRAERTTRGTRRSGGTALFVPEAAAYFEKMEALGVHLEQGASLQRLPDGTTRRIESVWPKRSALKKRLEQAARQAGGRLAGAGREMTEELLTTISFLAEAPEVAIGRFDPKFLELPAEVLETAMAKHLKLFGVRGRSGRLQPNFLAVLEGKGSDPKRVLANTERILEARFVDARFFYRDDTRLPLEGRVPALAQVVFHEKLGSVADRLPRIQKLAETIAAAAHLPEPVARSIPRAVRLLKADLVTQMVREFPSLQGVVGGCYAAASGEPAEVVETIAQQYAPRSQSDPLPSGALAAVIGLADRLDMLAGFFAAGLKPTGSLDPYALRRQALGAVRILLSNPGGIAFHGVSIDTLFETGIQSYPGFSVEPALLRSLTAFMRERFEWLMAMEYGPAARPMIEAVLAADGSDLAGAALRLRVLAGLWNGPAKERQLLEQAAKVAERSGRITQGLGKEPLPGAVDAACFRGAEEKALWTEWQRLSPQLNGALNARDYAGAVRVYGTLYPAVHAFFENVFVMDEDVELRRNRLAMLRDIYGPVARGFADLSKLPLSGVAPAVNAKGKE